MELQIRTYVFFNWINLTDGIKIEFFLNFNQGVIGDLCIIVRIIKTLHELKPESCSAIMKNLQ